MNYMKTRNGIVYVHIMVRASRPAQGRKDFFVFSKARFSKCFEWFGSMLPLCTATMVWTPTIPHFSFWDQSYRFAPNSMFQSAREGRETQKWVELSQESTHVEGFVA